MEVPCAKYIADNQNKYTLNNHKIRSYKKNIRKINNENNIEHIDGDVRNNRILNLRVVSQK